MTFTRAEIIRRILFFQVGFVLILCGFWLIDRFVYPIMLTSFDWLGLWLASTVIDALWFVFGRWMGAKK